MIRRFFTKIRAFIQRMKMYFAVKNSCKCMACGKHAVRYVKNYQWSAAACQEHIALAIKLTDQFAEVQHQKDCEAIASLRSEARARSLINQ